MDTAFTHTDMGNLANLLDARNAEAKAAFERPESQVVGYSLAETATPGVAVEASQHPSQAPAGPGSVYVPPTVGNNNPHLPTVSGSKAAQLAAAKAMEAKKPKGNAIWDDDEVDQAFGAEVGTATQEAAESRKVPEYDVVYKQRVTAEDQFLGADFTRDGSAESCEEIVAKVALPDLRSVATVDIDVTATVLHLRSPEYKLAANLPTKVVEKKGAAKWDPATKTLSITLTVDPSQHKVMMV